MNPEKEPLSIGALARLAGVNVETIRYYQRKRLLREPARPPGGIRRYASADVARVRFVKSAQALGFSLREVAQLLELEDGAHCREAAELAARHLTEVRTRLADLARMEKALSALVRQCRSHHGNITCPLIVSLQRDSVVQRGRSLSRPKRQARKPPTSAANT